MFLKNSSLHYPIIAFVQNDGNTSVNLRSLIRWRFAVEEVNVLAHQGDYVQHANLEACLGATLMCANGVNPAVQQDLVVGRRAEADLHNS